MEEEKLKSPSKNWDQQKIQIRWIWMMLVFCILISLFAWYIRYDPAWNNLSVNQQNRLRYHAKIWENLPLESKKQWHESQKRFHHYGKKDQDFLRQISYYWASLSSSQQQHRYKIYHLFASLSPQQQADIKNIAVFFECFALSNSILPNDALIHEWNMYYKTAPHLSPLQYRNYILLNFILFTWLPFLPNPIRERWQTMNANERWEVLQKIQKASSKRQQNLWLNILRQETQN